MNIQLVPAIECLSTVGAAINKHFWEVDGLQVVLAMYFLSMHLATESAHKLLLVGLFI